VNFARRLKCYKCGNSKPDQASFPIIHQSLPPTEELPESKPEVAVKSERVRVEEEMKRWEKEQAKVERINKQL
jgi:hypothetical protein